MGRDCNAPSEERPVEPQTGLVREQVDEQQQDVDEHIDADMGIKETELLDPRSSQLVTLLVLHSNSLLSIASNSFLEAPYFVSSR